MFYSVQVSGTRMNDRLAKLLVQDSGNSNLDGKHGSCAIIIMYLFNKVVIGLVLVSQLQALICDI